MPSFTPFRLPAYAWVVLLLVDLVGTARSGRAQTPAWNAAIELGSAANGLNAATSTNRMLAGPGGSVYAAGALYGRANFGGLPTVRARGGFVGRVDAGSGQWQWVVPISSRRESLYVTDLAGDSQQRLFVGGYTTPSAPPDSIRFGSIRTYGTGFVGCLTAAGQWQWATAVPGAATVLGVAADGTGGAFVAGTFVGTVMLGSTALVNPNPSYTGGLMVTYGFVAHLNAAGQWTWATPFAGNGATAVRLAVGSQGQVVVAGSFGQQVTIGGGPQLTGATFSSLVVATLAGATGAYQSAVVVDNAATVGALRLDAADNAYVLGNNNGTATFGATTVTTTGGYVARLSAAGQWQWATGVDRGGFYYSLDDLDLSVVAGAVYVGGVIRGRTTFGSTTLQPPNSSYQRGYLACLDVNLGQWQWAHLVAGANTVNGLALDAAGTTLYAGGVVTNDPAATFGTTTINGYGGVAYAARFEVGPRQWGWVAAPLVGGGTTAQQVAVDPQGNVTVLLGVNGEVQLGPYSLTPTANYVARRAPTGQWLWVVPVDGLSGGEYATQMSVDGQGNVYLAGRLAGGRFGAIQLPQSTRSTTMVVAKLSAAGQWLWATPFTSGSYNSYSFLSSLAVDAAGNATVGGVLGDTARFGPALRLITTTMSSSSRNSYVARLNTAGQWQWAAQTQGRGDQRIQSVATNATGAVAVAGFFDQPITLGPVVLTPGNSGYSPFVGYLSATGQWTDAKAVGGTDNFYLSQRVAMGPAGEVVLTGEVTDPTATFGPLTYTRTDGSGYVARLSAGTHQWEWVHSLGSSTGRLFAIPNSWPSDGVKPFFDAQGNAYVCGLLEGTLALGSATLNAGGSWGRQAAVASLDPAGQWRWAVQSYPHPNTFVYANSFAVAGTDQLVMAGSHSGPIRFGATTLPGDGALNSFLTTINLSLAAPADREALTGALWPNPARGTAHLRRAAGGPAITVAVLDGLGRCRLTVAAGPADTDVVLPLAGLTPGLYLVRADGQTYRLVVE